MSRPASGLLGEVQQLRVQRDRARRIAVTLEQQMAQVEALVEQWGDGSLREGRPSAFETLHAIRLVLGTPDEEVAS